MSKQEDNNPQDEDKSDESKAVGVKEEPSKENTEFNFKDDFLINFVLLVLIGGVGVGVFALELLPSHQGAIFISLAILFSSVLISPFIDIKQI